MYNLSDLRVSSDKQLQDKLILNDWNFMSLRRSLVKNKDFVHTFKVGSVINLEFDIIGKYISRMIAYK